MLNFAFTFMMRRKIYIPLVIVVALVLVNSCRLQKGFQALDVYNYFAAKQNFEKSLKSDTVPASYGLSIIYLRSDNPFFNIDSSLRYIGFAANNYPSLKPKEKERYLDLKVDSLAIFEFRDDVSEAHYKKAKEINTVERFQLFIDQNEWSSRIDSAVFYRDELAFNIVDGIGSSKAYFDFLQTYPKSSFKEVANSAYERELYRERTENNNIVDYIAFLKEFPNTPYRADAEDQIYLIYTKTGSLEAYKRFIKEYPENRNVAIAWKKMFNAHLQKDYSSSSIQSFLNEFKDYPFKDELQSQLVLADRILLPIKERNKWGFIDVLGESYIKPKYESAENFHEGLAIVEFEGKYGFIDKTGELAIDAIFDDAYEMNEGHAVVEIEGKWGMINRSGEFVVQPNYDDLGNLTEGFAYFAIEDTYGYFDSKGIERLKPQYTGADNFKNGKAIVSRNDYYGLIDVFGTTTIPFKYERLKEYANDTYIAKSNDKWGLVNAAGAQVLAFEYDYIGSIMDNRAIVEKDGVFNYIAPNGALILEEWLETYPEYRQLAIYQNSFARIEYEDGYNLLDTTGKKLFSKNKEDIKKYSEYIAVKKKDKWGYVSPKGSVLVNYNFTSAESFINGKALAGGFPLVGVINKKGEYLIEPYFEKIEFINDTLAITKSRGNYGMLNLKGDTILPFKFVGIEPYVENVVQIETKEAIYYYSLDQVRFLRKPEE